MSSSEDVEHFHIPLGEIKLAMRCPECEEDMEPFPIPAAGEAFTALMVHLALAHLDSMVEQHERMLKYVKDNPDFDVNSWKTAALRGGGR